MLIRVYIIITFWLCLMACGISVFWLQTEPRPQQWKPRILTIRPSENSKSTLLKTGIYYTYYSMMWLIMRILSFISCTFKLTACLKDSTLNESSVYQILELIIFSIKMAIMLEMDEFHLLFWMRKLNYPYIYSSVLAWRIPGTGEPSGLPSMGSHRVGHDWSDLAAAAYP